MYFLTRQNMNINHALQGDVECPKYRQQVFPGYLEWSKEIKQSMDMLENIVLNGIR